MVPPDEGVLEGTGAVTASGLPGIGDLPWGSHLCHFYKTRDDLVDALVPYFQAGVANGEQCLWVTCEPLRAEEAKAALRAAMPEIDRHLRSGQIEIKDYGDWYVQSGDLNPAGVLRRWLQREEEALRHGYRGLRISGNTFWLEPGDWTDFAEYESEVQRAFHDRRIVALCSYSLERCSIDDLIDVVRNHGCTLVRRAGTWEVARSATSVLHVLGVGTEREREGGEAAGHAVHLYADEFPAARVAGFLRQGLGRSDGAGVAVARREHLAALEAALARSGVDVARERDAGRLLLVDARESLARFRQNGHLDQGCFETVAAELIDGVGIAYPAFHVYAEMVDLLCEEGDFVAALRLERWWNGVLERNPFPLLCGYATARFDGVAEGQLGLVCAEHTQVDGVERADAGPLVARLRQQRRALQSEQEMRRELEQERARLLRVERVTRARAERAAFHLSQLQRVTSALSEAASAADIAKVVVRDVGAVVGADQAVVMVCGNDGARLSLLDYAGLPAEATDRLRSLPLAAPHPLATAFQTGTPVWLSSSEEITSVYPELTHGLSQAIACVPLRVGGRRLGVIGIGFTSPRRFRAADRALLDDLARQVALALDRAHLYDRARRDRVRAEEANRAKDEFLAMLGHELRNPLSPILTALQLMRLRAGDVLAKERDIIERQVRRMTLLVDDLLDVSRITRGMVNLERTPVELAAVVADAIETASPLLEERSHRLDADVPSAGLPVLADADRLAQVIANLLTNAAKYTPPGGSIRMSARASDGQVLLRVSDNGIGIEPELLPQLFDLFVQGRRSLDRSEGGLGLGLTIVRSLVEMHGGTVRVHSDGPGRGSEFVVELPLCTAARPASGEAPTPTPLPRRDGDGRRILVVDDNVDAADALADALAVLGHEPRTASDGPSALIVAKEFRPELALLDIGLPVMDGYELAGRLRELLAATPPKLVALTGYGLGGDRARSAAAGFDAHLVKPVDLDHLHGVIRDLVETS